MKYLKITDPQVYKLIKREEERQKEVLEMIPSENYTSSSVLEALGTVLNNKYSEGYPRRRYYQGNAIADEVILNTLQSLNNRDDLIEATEDASIMLLDISSTFINSDYDENRMADRLYQLGIYQFTSSLEKVAADRSSLTEGFMPIMWTDNKLTKKINNLVTDYQ